MVREHQKLIEKTKDKTNNCLIGESCRRSSSRWSKSKVEVVEVRRGPSTVTRRAGRINPRINSKSISRQMEMEILRKQWGSSC